MRLRKSTDGSLFAPHRGKPPACPDGYERDPVDQYRFLPELEPCEHRLVISEESSCCGKISVMRCAAKNNKVILKSDCLACINKTVKISIIIINTRTSKHLEKVLQSIHRQLLDGVEILILDGGAEELAKKYEARYEPVSIDKALELVTGQIVVTTYARVYQLFDCLETLVAPLLEDDSLICIGKVKSDEGGKYLSFIEAKDFNNQDVWEGSPVADDSLLYAMHRNSISGPKGKYLHTDAWAIDLGE